jgi:esterase
MELFYQKSGKGHPLIILHGLFGMSDNWISIAKALEENYTIYAVDQRNHGRSKHHEVFNYEAMVDDLHEFMEEQALKSAYLLGHSMGGKTAMQFAFDHPEKVDKLVVADISPDSYNHRHDKIIEALLSVDLEKHRSRAEIRKILNEKLPDERITNFLLKNLHWKDRSSLGWKANLEVIHANLQEVFRAVDTLDPFEKPTLFLRGGKSNYITDSHLPIIEHMFPKSDVKTIEGASHWLHAEKPEEFVQLLREFLA